MSPDLAPAAHLNRAEPNAPTTKEAERMDGNGSVSPDAAAKQLDRPVKFKHVEPILDEITAPIRENFQRLHDRITALEARPSLADAGTWKSDGLLGWLGPELHALEQRLAELEQRPLLEDGGIWSGEKTYRPGDVVTDSGTIWVALQVNISSRPGHSEKCWRLMVKSKGRV